MTSEKLLVRSPRARYGTKEAPLSGVGRKSLFICVIAYSTSECIYVMQFYTHLPLDK